MLEEVVLGFVFFLICLYSLSSENGSVYVLQDQEEEEEGVSRVRVTSRRSPHKVERVSGLVTRSHVDMPKVSKAKQKGNLPGAS